MEWFTQTMLDHLNARTGQNFTAAVFTADWAWIQVMFELNDNVVLLKTDHGLMLGIYDGGSNERAVIKVGKDAQAAAVV